MPVRLSLHLLQTLLFLAMLFAGFAARGQTNGATREVWYNLSGGAVADLTNAARFPNDPDELSVSGAFEAPSQFADSYGQRMRALLVAPVTGPYVFFIASDDGGALYLSTNEDPAKKVRIAYESGWAGIREYLKTPTAKSAPINLTSGARYYIEALQKEGGGGDNLAVTWQKPGDPAVANGAEPIPGNYLIPVGLNPPVISRQPTNLTVVEADGAVFAIDLVQRWGSAYQWFRNDQPLPEGTNAVLLLPRVTLADSSSRFRCFVQNGYGSTNSSTATLTVVPDSTPPVVQSAGGLGDADVLTVVFSEPVEEVTATNAANYLLDGGVQVLSATWGFDNRTIVLRTTPMGRDRDYTLTVLRVRDRASTPNTIPDGTHASFNLTPTPVDFALTRPAAELLGPASRRGAIVISEIMFHPTNAVDGGELEFIELYNSNPFAEDISGFRLAGEVTFTFPTNAVVPGRSTVVLAANPADLRAAYGSLGTLVAAYTNKLSNSSGELLLLNRQGGIISQVRYGPEGIAIPAADGAGHSLVLARPSLGERNPEAWAASDLIGGTPGRAEIASVSPYAGLMLNEILAHTDLPQFDYIELYNATSAAIALDGCIVTDSLGTNRYVFPPRSSIPGQSRLLLDESMLGFRLSAAGETLYLFAPARLRVIDALAFGPQENGIALGRYPDGAPGWRRLQAPSPGSPNPRYLISDVVINEIMYDPITGNPDDEYIELYNHTDLPVDMGGWRLASAVKFTLPVGTVIAPRDFLVIAKNPAVLLPKHPHLTATDVLGNYSGNLARRGDRIVLSRPDMVLSTNSTGQVNTNFVYIEVDDVAYGSGGRWAAFAKKGGSSLELRNPRSDHRLAPNWAASDESAKSDWVTIEFTGVLDHGDTGVAANSLHAMLLGSGECLVDNVEVIVGAGQNLVSNPDFDTGLDGWVPQGNHERSSWNPDAGINGTGCLHIRAPAHGDTGANRIRTTLKSTLAQGQTATIRAKVRWLAGWPEILFRIRGNWIEATGNILRAQNLGTPGAPNSRAEINVGPAISDVRHWPVLPANAQAVTVTARVDDPDGLAGLVLNYRIDPSTNTVKVTMANCGGGLFSGTIPGQSAGKIAAFHLHALDNASAPAVTVFPVDAPSRECLVRWGEPGTPATFGTYRVWMTQATLDRWSRREKLSNQPLDCTFVYGNSRVIYNIGGQYSGSPWHSPGYNSPVGNVCDYVINFPEDDRFLGEKDATLQWPGNGGGDNTYQREQTAYWIAEQMGLPYCYRRSVNLFINGVRRAEMFEDAQQPNGDMTDQYFPEGADGDLHKIQVWYEFDDAASNFSGRGASFGNVTTTGGQKKLAVYRWTFARRAVQDSMSNYTNLYALLNAVNYSGLGPAYRQQLESKADVDNWLRTYAVQHAVGNSDSFAYGGGQNMYTYKPRGQTWKMLIWDIDFAFVAQPADSDMWSGIGRSNGIDLNEPNYRRRYWEILQDLANGPLVSSKVAPVVDGKYSAMVANGRSIESPASIKNYIDQRRTYLLNQIAQNVPSAFGLTLNNGVSFATNRNQILLTGRAGLDVRRVAVNGVVHPVTWTSVSNWTVMVALSPGVNILTVTGLNDRHATVVGASGSITITNTAATDAPENKLMISEIMYNPLVANGAFVELHNASASTAFDLSGWRLGGADFVFPGGSVISPGEYRVIAADRLSFAQAYSATLPLFGVFQGNLQNEGETLRLLRPGPAPDSEILVDEVRYESDAPWPTSPNGLGPSLQLVDASQDNNRVGNWDAINLVPGTEAPRWRYAVANGTASSSTLYMYLTSPGEVYVDDLKLVAGNVAEQGPNLLLDSDFEGTFPGAWGLASIFASSAPSTTYKHGGARSLRVISTGTGSSRFTSIYQDIQPYLTLGDPYTLSYWYLENPNGGRLVIRLSGNGVSSSVDLADPTSSQSARATPGIANSVSRVLPRLPLVWLNEISPTNFNGPTDRFGRRSPWVELHNSSATNVSLAGLFLANSTTNLLQWRLPGAATLAPRQFMLIWLDGRPEDTSATEPHASFTVPTRTGLLVLTSTNGGSTNIVDYLRYDLSRPNSTYGAYPDAHAAKRQEFFLPTPGASNNPASPPLSIFINEWMADNQTTVADPADNDFEDWFELYNPGDATADLTGFYFGTSLSNRTKYLIPPGYLVPPQGHLLVWADSESSQNSSNRADLHVNFKLSRSGEAIGLFAPDGTIIDYVEFGAQGQDTSFGRYPDGDNAVYSLTAPTPRKANFLQLGNTAPVLQPLPEQTIFEGQLLVYQLQAFDADLPPQNVRFSLAPGAPEEVVVNALTGLLSWRPAPESVGKTYNFTLTATDDGQPPLSDSGVMRVTVLPLPKVTSVQPEPGACVITFATVPGRTYRLEYTDSLLPLEWKSVVSENYLANGTSLTITDDTLSASQRFYRVTVLP